VAWTKPHHHSYSVVAVFGLVARGILAGSGEQVFALGRVDWFSLTLVAFGLLLVVSLTDTYSREDSGLDPEESAE
jgi:hypothetical protein